VTQEPADTTAPAAPIAQSTLSSRADRAIGSLAPATAAALWAAGLDADDVVRAVRVALDEDFRYGPDVTSLATAGDAPLSAHVVAREDGVLAGIPVALAVLDLIAAIPDGELAAAGTSGMVLPGSGPHGDRTQGEGGRLSGTVLRPDGSRVRPGDAVLRVSGPATEVLGAERTLLNFLTHLSGVATATRAWADAVADTDAVIRDTRKTTPGLRQLEKYAVRCGGGANHRMGLGDAALIKDNHVAAAGGVAKAIEAVRAAVPGMPLEVECDTLLQVLESLEAGATLILLDNMPVEMLRSAVAEARRYPGVRLEASGGLRLSTAREVAATGVDYLSVGALTHSSPVLDLGLDFLS
jgi:nicotinate-nucleotide pyrophosphorylase (carboxylating)